MEEITRYVLGESSENEKIKIEQMIKSDNELKKLVQEMRLIVSVKQKPFKVSNADKKWKSVKSELNGYTSSNEDTDYYLQGKGKTHMKRGGNRFMRVWQYAAAAILLIGISYYILQRSQSGGIEKGPEYRTLLVKNSERKTVVLYDGTTINLDSGSELKYPKSFKNTRTVYLNGEALFQVAKDPERPFYVYANEALIRVVGTKFDVRSWRGDNKGVTVTVKEGIVKVSSRKSGAGDDVFLYKNMQSRVSPDGVVSKPIMVDASDYLRWMNNEIHFQDASLREILSQMERWYDLKFEVDDELLEKKNLTVHLTSTNLNELLELISKMTNTRIERHGKIIKFIK
jgi:ferric-dicitrate binding protein FerR (iron transport regulator)